jgi:hypothetical protein
MLAASAEPQSDEFLLSESPAGSQLAPEVAALPSGGFVAAWEWTPAPNDPQVDEAAQGVRARVFDAKAVPVTGDIDVVGRLVSKVAGAKASVDVESLGEGQFIVTWLDLPPEWDALPRIAAVKFEPHEGSADGYLSRTLAFSVCEQYAGGPDVAPLPDGRFALTWIDMVPCDYSGYDQVQAQIFAADGDADSLVTPIGVPGSIVYSPHIVSLADGTLYVQFHGYQNGQYGMFLQHLGADGWPEGETVGVDSDDLTLFEDPSGAAPLPGGGFVLVGVSYGVIRLMAFDDSAVLAGHGLPVNSWLGGDPGRPDVAVDQSGDVLVVWQFGRSASYAGGSAVAGPDGSESAVYARLVSLDP